MKFNPYLESYDESSALLGESNKSLKATRKLEHNTKLMRIHEVLTSVYMNISKGSFTVHQSHSTNPKAGVRKSPRSTIGDKLRKALSTLELCIEGTLLFTAIAAEIVLRLALKIVGVTLDIALEIACLPIAILCIPCIVLVDWD